MIDVGGIRTDGILGEHFIRILSYGDGGRRYAITVDGEHRQAQTDRGILRCVAQMIFKKVSQKDTQ
jgi:hypothetical protein